MSSVTAGVTQLMITWVDTDGWDLKLNQHVSERGCEVGKGKQSSLEKHYSWKERK